jgi:hypothetical protein
MNFLNRLKKDADRGRQKVMKDERRLKSSRLNGRLVFTIIFWAVMLSVIFFSFQSWARTGFLNEKVNGYQIEAKEEIASLAEKGFSNSPAGEDYTHRFIETYINVPAEEEERAERENELQAFLAEGLTVEELENILTFEGKRVLKNASLYDVRDVSREAANYVYQVEYELFKLIETKEQVEVKEVNEDGEEVTVTKKKVNESEKSIGKKEVLVVVRVGTDGSMFNVIQQPHYQSLPAKSRLTAIKDETDPAQKNPAVEDQLQQFATQFFTSYTTNTVAEMAYLMEKPETLFDLYQYKGLENFIVYDGEKEGQYIVKTLVLFQEADSGLQTKHPFTLIVSKENNKFYVHELKHTLGG